ncbi:muscle M-line assembly protein unc-89 [Diachasma alloeum]|uniref:muscle M-line assembly protein unc-89 n=1 Tax=Diachasma alloeum TaxID=454923 RepID=UPI0007383B0C|nr:muscle M-line assembly protein unc-89 [Diachasma alloeum]
MNKEEVDNPVKMGETGVPDPEVIKKEMTNWPEIKSILDDGLNKPEEVLKTEENGASPQAEVEAAPEEEKNRRPIPRSEAPADAKIPEKKEAPPEEVPPAPPGEVIAKSEGAPEAPEEENSPPGEAEESPEAKVETIQLIEEIIVIPVQDPGDPECPEAPAEGAPPEAVKPEPQEPKARSVIEVIYEDWSDGNVEEEEMSRAPDAVEEELSRVPDAVEEELSRVPDAVEEELSRVPDAVEEELSRVPDAVEDQLKSLLEERAPRSPKTRSRAPSPQVQSTPEPPPKAALDPAEVPLKQEEKKPPESVDEPSSDSKELLAILEGDVEPDWSDLKPPKLTVESSPDQNVKPEDDNSPPKLDPLTERQLALKQLLELPMTSKKPRISPRKSPVVPKQILEEDESVEEFKVDETRSGRKRKPTEKAREHEITAKRQKVVRVKTPPEKTRERSLKDSKSPSPGKKIVRKVPQKPANALRTRKSPKPGSPDGAPKRKKTVNEIDRLLQDEGVVNLLYDVEQPQRRRLVPVTKSQAKVMDIQKVQRELKIRTKLVKNAVLRLRTSAGPGASAPRAKRISAGSGSLEEPESPTATPTKSSIPGDEFLLPAKIRNAADASVIVRRHSSSSFSSASGSPRVSVDSNDRQMSYDDGRGHLPKSGKRSHPLGERKKVEGKKAKKSLDRGKSPAGKGKPVERKKMMISKDPMKDDEEEDEKSGALRSNGTAGRLGKPRKSQKNKVTFAKHADLDDSCLEEDEDDLLDGLHIPQGMAGEDELSACLAEAVTALANDSATRGKNSVLNRKGKSREQRGKDGKAQFSNKEINVQRHANLVQLILTPSTTSKIRNGITLQMMQEFREVLSILKKDDDCRMVLLTSTGSSFCEGLELSTLLEENKDVRRANAQLLADGVKDFIKSLATFNKPIVAGVQGSAVGLGVTMLPLFDLVIASDKASFSTPYGKLGQIAEGAAVFTLSHVLGSAVTSELLLGGRTLTANEALRAGLVTRVLWPDRFHVELLPSLRAMSEQSSQSMEATKALLRHSLRSKLAAALESESYLLVQHWCSTECQNAIRAYMDEKVQ